MPAVSGLFTVFYALVAGTLTVIALVVTGTVWWDLAAMFRQGQLVTDRVLERGTLVILAMAIIDVGKYLWEEEVLRDRELRSASEARRSLTKFMVIICIAMSLEALVYIARLHDDDDISLLIYPAALFACAVLAMVGLGVYQFLSASTESRVRDDPQPRRPRRGRDG